MCHGKLLKLFLVVLALALWAGTANAQVTATYTTGGASVTNVYLSYVSGGTGNVTSSAAITLSLGVGDSSGDTYTATPSYTTGNNWLSTTGAGSTLPETDFVISLGTPPAAGAYSGSISIQDTTSNTAAYTVNVFLVVAPLSQSGTAPATSLTYVQALGGTQATTAQTTVTVASVDPSNFDTFTVTPNSNCNWLAISPTSGYQAKHGTTQTLTISMNPANLPASVATAQSVTNCSIALKYNNVTFYTYSPSLYVVGAQPLTATAPTYGSVSSLIYNKGTSSATQATASTTVKVVAAAPTSLFSLDLATMPAWLAVQSGLSPTYTANANSGAGDTVVFTVNTAVAAGMATGNYVANVGFYVSGCQELTVPISLQVSNASPSVTEVPSAAQNISYTVGSATPVPVATLYSSDEPVPFTATCTVVYSGTYTATAGFTTPCQLNGQTGATANVVNGTTFTWGYQMTATLDGGLFAATVGNTVQVTFTFSGIASPPAPVVYTYTIQPGIPTATSTVPTSISANFPHADAPVVLVKGTNFIGTASIAGSSVVQTQVWIGSTLLTSSNANSVGSYVVVNSNLIQVTLAAGTLPAVAAGKTGSVVIGVANQIAAAAPAASQASATLNVTNSPVIYAMTDTASFLQPAALGGTNSFAPYELVSIFGDNFGLTGSASASAAFDSYGKVITPMVLTPAQGSTKATTLAVTFTKGTTVFTAPVLFSNQNQINAIVPSGITVGNNYTVTVTAAGLSSDALYTVGTQAADPGVFTLLSDGTGGGAIINQNGSINGVGHVAHASDVISIYLTGLGVPDSTGVDAAQTTNTGFPDACVAISNTASGTPGLLQVVNTKVGSTYASPNWTSIDGAIMNYGAHDIIEGTAPNTNYPPCMATATITVSFGPSSNQVISTTIDYAGFRIGGRALPDQRYGSGKFDARGRDFPGRDSRAGPGGHHTSRWFHLLQPAWCHHSVLANYTHCITLRRREFNPASAFFCRLAPCGTLK